MLDSRIKIKDKKIVIASMYFPPDRNGMAVYAGKLYEFLLSLGLDVLVITRYLPNRQIARQIVQIKVPSVRLNKKMSELTLLDPRLYSIKFSQAVFQAASKINNIEIIHYVVCWDDYVMVYPHLYQPDRDYRIFLTIGGGGIKAPKELNTLRTKILNETDAILFFSHQIKKQLKKMGITDSKMVYTPPSVNAGILAYRKPVFRNKITVLYLGRIVREKGVFDIVKIALKLRDHFDFLVVGEGEDKQSLMQLIKTKKISNVKLFSGVDHLQTIKYYHGADIFLHPTYDDEFPVTVLEAMSCGLPIVTTPMGEIPSVVKAGKNGFLCLPGDINCFVSSLRKLTDFKTRREFNMASRMIAQNYSGKKSFSTVKKIYKLFSEMSSETV